jgi:hypothetical protein
MGMAIASGQLHHAQRIAAEAQAHSFGVNGDGRSQIKPVRQIAFVVKYGQNKCLLAGTVNNAPMRFGLIPKAAKVNRLQLCP